MADYYAHQAEDNRTRALAEGGQINDQIQQNLNNRYGLESGYQTRADTLYEELMNNPGYTDEEKQAILDQAGLNNLQLTPEQQQSNYLTPEEQIQMRGDPTGIVTQSQHAGQMAYSSLADTANNVSNAQTFERDSLGNSQNALASNTRGVINPSKLALSPDYATAQDAALSKGGSSIRAAVNNPALQLSQDYLQNHKFDANDQEQMALDAERDIGAATRSRQEDVQRAAEASGGVAPLALASGLNRLQQQGDINAEDAALAAKVQAKKLGLDTTQQTEDTRQAAMGRNASLQASAEQNLLGANLTAAQEREQLRQGAEQYITGTQLQNEQNIGQQDLANQRLLGGQDVASQQQLGQENLAGTEWAEGTQLGTAANAEQQTADRSAQLALNRQNTNQYNQGSAFQRGTYADTASSGRNTTVANQRIGGQQETRGYYTGQMQYEGNQAANAQQQQLQNYATKYGLANQATQTAGQIDIANKQNSFFGSNGLFGKLAGAAGGAASAYFKG